MSSKTSIRYTIYSRNSISVFSERYRYRQIASFVSALSVGLSLSPVQKKVDLMLAHCSSLATHPSSCLLLSYQCDSMRLICFFVDPRLVVY